MCLARRFVLRSCGLAIMMLLLNSPDFGREVSKSLGLPHRKGDARIALRVTTRLVRGHCFTCISSSFLQIIATTPTTSRFSEVSA